MLEAMSMRVLKILFVLDYQTTNLNCLKVILIVFSYHYIYVRKEINREKCWSSNPKEYFFFMQSK